MNKILLIMIAVLVLTMSAISQAREPSTTDRPWVVQTKQQVADIQKALQKQDGNKNQDVIAANGIQMRVAVFHDEHRENNLNEVHDGSDDIYYVLDGKATLMLGGTLIAPEEISSGEWRSKSANGGQSITIRKGDLVVVPRGTRHQRTVTGKGFSMILIKVFESPQPAAK